MVSTNSLLAAPAEGARPRYRSVPPAVRSSGHDAVLLAAEAGLILDPWQQHVLTDALGEQDNGRWSAFEVALIVPRQNGKGSVLEARALAGLFLFGEELIMWSAHEFKTAQEAYRRVRALIENTPSLHRRVKRYSRSNGDEGIELKDGARLRFVARSKSSGRGFSADCLILDEAFNLAEEGMAAMMPTMSARMAKTIGGPQIWYASSAPLPSSEVLRSICLRGRKGGHDGLAYSEWCSDPELGIDNPKAWEQANPAFNIRIPEDYIRRELRAMGEAAFAQERCGHWSEIGTTVVIPADTWSALTDPNSDPTDTVAFSIDMPRDRSRATICMASYRHDGKVHVEVVDQRPGSRWVVDRLLDLSTKWSPVAIMIDPGSAVGSLIPDFNAAGVYYDEVSARSYAQACGAFYDLATSDSLRHVGQTQLTEAVEGAKQRQLTDAWAWDKKHSGVDISPLVAATLAAYGLALHGSSTYDDREMLVL